MNQIYYYHLVKWVKKRYADSNHVSLQNIVLKLTLSALLQMQAVLEWPTKPTFISYWRFFIKQFHCFTMPGFCLRCYLKRSFNNLNLLSTATHQRTLTQTLLRYICQTIGSWSCQIFFISFMKSSYWISKEDTWTVIYVSVVAGTLKIFKEMNHGQQVSKVKWRSSLYNLRKVSFKKVFSADFSISIVG